MKIFLRPLCALLLAPVEAIGVTEEIRLCPIPRII
jgi:hypothetical protein